MTGAFTAKVEGGQADRQEEASGERNKPVAHWSQEFGLEQRSQ